MKRTYSYTDIAKAFGKQNYVIYQKDYNRKLLEHPLISGLWTVGRCFSIIANTHSWQTEMVTGDSIEVSGYSREEVLNGHAQFVAQFILPDDMPFVMSIMNSGMEYLHSLPIEQRDHMYVTYFSRAVRKDGKIITIQNQSIPLVFDEQKIPFIFGNFISDITYLNPTNIPHALVVNRFTNEQLHLDPVKLRLNQLQTIFTKREKELIQLFIKGVSSREAAEILNLSYETVRTHRKNIQQKAGVRNTSQLVRYVLMNEQLLIN